MDAVGDQVPAGTSLGVEEEYHLVDPRSLQSVNRAALSALADQGRLDSRVHAEMLTCQLEAVTEVCTELTQLRTALVGARAAAACAAAEHDARILATSTHPTALLADVEVSPRARYELLHQRFGAVVRQFNLCGCHVHVSVPDLETAVAIANHCRPYLPLLATLTSSSAFHEGRDTGFDSFRLAQLALWPQGGLPPYLGSARAYLAVVEELTALGLIDDATMLLWELRPSARYPTLEFRIGDVSPWLDDVVLFAGLVRSLVRVLAGRLAQGIPPNNPPDAVLRASRWRATRYGLAGALWSVSRQAVVAAPAAVGDLWAELEADLAEHGEDRILRPLLGQLLTRGTSARQQRRTFAATGDLNEVVREAVDLTAPLPKVG